MNDSTRHNLALPLVVLWSLGCSQSPSPVRRLPDAVAKLKANTINVGISRDGSRFAVGVEGRGEVVVFEMSGGAAYELSSSSVPGQPHVFALSADGRSLVVPVATGGCALKDADSTKVKKRLAFGGATGCSWLAATASGDAVCASFVDGTVRFASTSHTLGSPWIDNAKGEHGRVVYISPDGRRVLVLSHQGPAAIFDAGSGDKRADIRHPGGRAYGARFSVDGSLLALWGSRRSLSIWDVKTASMLASKAPGTVGVVIDAHITPDNESVLYGESTGSAHLWAWRRGAVVRSFPHAEAGNMMVDVHLTADGRFAATAGEGGLVKVWRVSTGECVAILETGLPSTGSSMPVTPMVSFVQGDESILGIVRPDAVCTWQLPASVR